MISAAATLHAQGKTDIATAAEAAEALRPIAGDFAFALFSLGIIGTGLLSLPVLAGSAAYAFGEAQGWKCGLENKPWEAVGFYSVIAAATARDRHRLFPLDPIGHCSGCRDQWLRGRTRYGGRGRQPPRSDGPIYSTPSRSLGWATTAVMAVAALAMLIV
jgi:hypothetical protein